MNSAHLVDLLLPSLGLGVALLALAGAPDQHLELPRRAPRPAYLGSEGCQMCHPGEYASWHDTYHRTMTRRPEELVWDGQHGPSLPVELEDELFSFRLVKDGPTTVVQGPDLHLAAQSLYLLGEQAKREQAGSPTAGAILRALERVPRVERPLALVTGSHHYLAFWLAAGEDRELRQLPFVYHLDERAWAPRAQAFLEPPDAPPYIATWNSNCIQCHAVAGEPQETEWRDSQGALHVRFRSRVAELGIACEACHGPGRAHAEHHRSPLARWPRSEPPVDARLTSPAKQDSERSSAVCGQCHAYFVPKNEATFWETGFLTAPAPGQPLDAQRQLLLPSDAENGSLSISREMESIFWPDGTMRVGGREYSGLVASACYSRGSGERKLSCGSCHSMHDSGPNDQLTRDAARDADAPCRECHSVSTDHSGHAPGSIGDSCVACHMPKTTYALLGSIRSHRIQIPRPTRTDVPSACALCHLDRSLSAYQGAEVADPAAAAAARGTPHGEIGVGIRGALAGNAAERAIYAAALGSPETRATIGEPLARALLERLATDRYHAVRRIAERGLATLPEAGEAAGQPRALSVELIRRLEGERDERDVVISE